MTDVDGGSAAPPTADVPSELISFRLRPELRDGLRDIAIRRGVSVSDLLREAAGSILCGEGLCTCPACPRRIKASTR